MSKVNRLGVERDERSEINRTRGRSMPKEREIPREW